MGFKDFVTKNIHPKPDDHGRDVHISSPHEDTPVEHWHDSNAHVTVTPNSLHVPESLNGVAFSHWHDAPTTHEGWNKVDGQKKMAELPIHNPHGLRESSGAIIHEPDGRVWVMHPTNAFGGYHSTFPKGQLDKGLNLQANAIKETHEETGLRIRITGHAADVQRSTSVCRYYHAERVGGHPKNMGWEAQAVSLVPRHKLGDVVSHPNDAKLVAAAQQPR